MKVHSYDSPAAFKKALEQRLKRSSSGGADLNRRRQLLVFDRFLARITQTLGDAIILKGGLVLELRLGRARTTKDIDLRMSGSADQILENLQQAGAKELSDFMTYIIQADARLPELTGDGIIYEGYRFRAECRLAGKIYGQRFGVDVAFGDPLIGTLDNVQTDDTLAFAGIEPPSILLYPVPSHIAEKLHAYTMPRDRPNSRVKDLPDIALLASVGSLKSEELRGALAQTFSARDTHPLPAIFPEPPDAWTELYAKMAERDGLAWPTIAEVTNVARQFLNPVLSKSQGALWDPQSWTWKG